MYKIKIINIARTVLRLETIYRAFVLCSLSVNTAKNIPMRTSNTKVHVIGREPFRACYGKGHLAVADRKTSFEWFAPIFFSMKKIINILSLLTMFLFVVSCDKDDSIIGNDESTSKIKIYQNLGSDIWDYMAVDEEGNFMISDEVDGTVKSMIGSVNNDTTYAKFNSNGLLESLESTNYQIHLEYLRDRVVYVYNVDSLCFNDTLKIDIEKPSAKINTRAATSDANVISNLVNDALGRIPIVGQIKAASELMNYLVKTDDMNNTQKLDYYADGKHQWVNEQKVKDWLKLGDEKKKSNPPTYYIGVTTGSAPYIYENSAKVNLDGILKIEANDGTFNCEYGICYSKSPSPNISQKVSKTLTSDIMPNSINLSMPIPFLIEGLTPNTTYYYRAYFKDNKTGQIFYSEKIKSFKTSSIPVTISNFVQTNSYFSKTGYSYSGKTYSYKYMTSLKIEISSLDNINDWGYYLVGDNGNRIAYSMMSRGSIRCDDILTVYSDRASTVAKIGGYVKYKSDNTAYYTDPNSYPLEYNDEIDITFYDCYFKEVTHFFDESLYSYRCGAIFDVNFRVKGAENLTSLSIVPYGNFLSWDSSKTYSTISDGDYVSTITCKYIYEYGLYGNFYCFIIAKDLNGKEHYSKNIVKMEHDGLHFTTTVVSDYESLLGGNTRSASNSKSEIPIHFEIGK